MSEKPYHFASKIRADGAVSALCYAQPRKIDLRRALWTIRRDAVTCFRCLALLAELDRVKAHTEAKHGGDV